MLCCVVCSCVQLLLGAMPAPSAPSLLEPLVMPLPVPQTPAPCPLRSMFVPAGWPHAVMNLDMTVAVTQNYVSSAAFADAWRHTKASSRGKGGCALVVH